MFPPELEREAFRSGNEFGWTRAQIPVVVEVLRSQGMAILGGELWYVRECHDGFKELYSSIPQREDIPSHYWGLYVWATDRRPGDGWQDFVERGALEALSAVARWPEPNGEGQPPDLPGQILYNLGWVSESEFEKVRSKPEQSIAKRIPQKNQGRASEP